MAGEVGKRRAWLTALGAWFRHFRPDAGLWNDASVNHSWIWDGKLPSIELPAVFALADQVIGPVQLYREARKRMARVLPDSDRVPVGISNIDGRVVVCLELEDFVDILTDSLLMRIESFETDLPPLFLGGDSEDGDPGSEAPGTGVTVETVVGFTDVVEKGADYD